MNFKMDVLADNGVPFRVVFLPFGESENYPAVRDGKPLVEFYDLRYKHTDDGQFVTRYNYDDLLDDHVPFRGLCLMGGVPNWTIDGDTYQLVYKWLHNFEIIPVHHHS